MKELFYRYLIWLREKSEMKNNIFKINVLERKNKLFLEKLTLNMVVHIVFYNYYGILLNNLLKKG
jgi:hypothetical protein